MRRVRQIGFLVCTSLLYVGIAFAQVTTATLRGRVLDPQGSPVSAATVTVSREDKAFSRSVSTEADGTFVIGNIPPSAVDVVVSAKGFADARRTGLLLEVGRTTTLDIDLKLGSVQETVDVGATAGAVDTSRSVVDAVIASSAIDALPLNGRNFLELALLVPGNAPAPNFDPTKSNSVLISSAGQLGRGGNVTIDGADNNDDVVGGPLQNVTQESVQEFQIATNRFTAESGRSASSVINVVTKSGTEQPIERVGEGQAFAAQVGQALMGPSGGSMVAVVVIICVLGSLAALQMMAPRTYFAMARDGVLPAAVAVIDTRFGTPVRAIATQAVLASIMVALGSFDTIVAYFVFIAVVFITATVASVFVLRRRDPTFHVPGYPLTPSAFMAMTVVLLGMLLMTNPVQAVLGIGLVALAVPVYRLVRSRPGASTLKEIVP